MDISSAQKLAWENKLAKGEMVLAGETIDPGNVTIPVYSLATREDHIAPAKSVFLGSKFFGGLVKFVVAETVTPFLGLSPGRNGRDIQ